MNRQASVMVGLMLAAGLAWGADKYAPMPKGRTVKDKIADADLTQPDAARHRLYTAPDPSASGGITGEIAAPAKPIEQIFAMPPDDPTRVYEGKVQGATRQAFRFENLPMARYDLFVVYRADFYEGLELTREADTLTEADREKVRYIVDASDPFFTQKVIHRVAGTTGRGNSARCVVTMWRDRQTLNPDDTLITGFRRTFKLIWLKDVGPGWQVVQKRDIYPLTVDGSRMNIPHHFSRVLSKIRVTDSVKELGALDLTKEQPRPVAADQGE